MHSNTMYIIYCYCWITTATLCVYQLPSKAQFGNFFSFKQWNGFYLGKLVSLLACSARASGFSRVFWPHQVWDMRYNKNKFFNSHQTTDCAVSDGEPLLWRSVSGLQLRVPCSASWAAQMQCLQFNQVKNFTWLIIMAQNLKSYLQNIVIYIVCGQSICRGAWTICLQQC